MIDKECYEKMESEIEKRMCSSDWDCTIASCVVSRHSKKTKRKAFAISISSFGLLATAAVIIFAVFINTPSGSVKMNDLEVFVSGQIDGTHREVFNEGYSKNVVWQVSSSEDTPIDSFIDNTLSVR